MANIKSAQKRILQSRKKTKHNSIYKSILKTFIKKTIFIISKYNKKKAIKMFIKTQKIIDRQVSKKMIHKNKASRYKSILFNKINNM